MCLKVCNNKFKYYTVLIDNKYNFLDPVRDEGAILVSHYY